MLSALLIAASSAMADEITGELRLRLSGALRVESRNREGASAETKAASHDLLIDAVCVGGKWEGDVWGHAPLIPGLEHLGRLTGSAGAGGAVELKVGVDVNPNRQSPVFIGGAAEYTIKLRLDGNAAAGEFTGRCVPTADAESLRRLEENFGFGPNPEEKDPRKQPTLANLWESRLAAGEVSGAVTGVLLRGSAGVAGAALPKGGEHPRLLFRKSDVPRLREWAATAQGKAALARVRELLEVRGDFPAFWRAHGPLRGAAMGFLYQMTGERRYADAARDCMWGNLYTAYGYGQWWFHAYTLQGLAIAYDCCYDAWDADTRRVFYAYLELQVRQHAQRHDRPDVLGTADRLKFVTHRQEYVYDPENDTARNDRFGAAMAAMAILNDPPEMANVAKLEGVPLVEPDDREPWFGVPVLPFEDDVMPRRWLINGPMLRGMVGDVAAAVGGLDKLRPRPGDVIEVDGAKLDWRLYRPAGVTGTAPGIYSRECSRYWSSATGGGYWPGIELTRRWAQTRGKYYPTNVWLYTVIRNDAERVVQALPNWRSASVGNRMWLAGRRLRDGELVRIRPGLYPLLVDVCLMGTYSSQSPRLREYTPADWRRESAAGRDAGKLAGGDLAHNTIHQDLLAMARSARRYVEESVDPNGWGLTSHRTLLPLLHACRNVTGVHLAAGTGFDEAVPTAARFAGHVPDIEATYTAGVGYGVAPRRHQPLAAWTGKKHGDGVVGALDAVIAMLAMPADAPAEGPERFLPLAQAYDRYGMTAFSSGLGGGQDFLAAAFTGDGSRTRRWCAGAFMLQGLGQEWALWRVPEVPQDRQFNGMAIDSFYAAAAPKVLGRELRADGSGSVSLRCEQYVRGLLVPTGQTRGGRPVYRVDLGNRIVPGASALRSIAVDYSGRCGAPVLLAVADRVVLPRRVEKAWRIDLGVVGSRLKLDKDGFLVTAKDGPATMRATFVRPEKVDFRTTSYGGNNPGTLVDGCVDRRATVKEKAGDAAFVDEAKGRMVRDMEREEGPRTGEKDIDKLVEEMQATAGEAPPATFLVILTVQVGAPPKVEVSGSGDSVVARVGKCTVRFNGERIVLGE